MKIPTLSVTLILFMLAFDAKADLRCYHFQNATNFSVVIRFSYSPGFPAATGATTTTIAPNGIYDYCMDSSYPPGEYTYADVENGNWAQLNGRLTMGYGPLASNPGKYEIVSGPTFNNSNYPGHDKFMVTHVDAFTYRGVDVGAAQLIHLSLTCRNGQKWNLVCLPNGLKCNIGIDELLRGHDQKDTGQHCE